MSLKLQVAPFKALAQLAVVTVRMPLLSGEITTVQLGLNPLLGV